MAVKNALLAEYTLFAEGIQAGCRSLDDMTEREYAGMLLKLFGPGAVDACDEESLMELLIEATQEYAKCLHEKCAPKRSFDPEKAAKMTRHQVLHAYPPFEGKCPDCGFLVVVYASYAHESVLEET